jgi:hypothetical protein
MPRMKDYSYMLMLIPALFVMKDIIRRRVAANYPLLAVALMLFTQPQQSNVPGLLGLIIMLQAYMPSVFSGIVMVYVLSVLLGIDSRGQADAAIASRSSRVKVSAPVDRVSATAPPRS